MPSTETTPEMNRQKLLHVAYKWDTLAGKNNSCERLLYLCEHFGDDEDVKKAQQLLTFRDENGGFSGDDPEFHEKWELHRKVYPRFKSALEAENLTAAQTRDLWEEADLDPDELYHFRRNNSNEASETRDAKGDFLERYNWAKAYLEGYGPELEDQGKAQHLEDADPAVFLAEFIDFFKEGYAYDILNDRFKKGLGKERCSSPWGAYELAKGVRKIILSESLWERIMGWGDSGHTYNTLRDNYDHSYVKKHSGSVNAERFQEIYLAFYRILNKALAARTGNGKLESTDPDRRRMHDLLQLIYIQFGISNYSQQKECHPERNSMFDDVKHGNQSIVLEEMSKEADFSELRIRIDRLILRGKYLRERYGKHYDPLVLIPAYKYPETQFDVKYDDLATQLDLLEDQMDYLEEFAERRIGQEVKGKVEQTLQK